MVPTSTGCKNAFDQLLFPLVPLRCALPRRSWRLVLSGGRPRPPLFSQVGFARKTGRTPLRRSGPRRPEKGSRIPISPARKSRFHIRPRTPETSHKPCTQGQTSSGGPMRASAPTSGQMAFRIPIGADAATTARAARSEAERAEREAAQMRPCTPTPSAPSATGRQHRTRRRP